MFIFLDCATGWTFYPHNKKCYKHFPIQMSWTEARAACQSMAPGTGELASVSDGVATAYFIEHLNYFLASLIPDTNPVFEAWGTGTLAFIGANRYSGGWAWNDGNPWQYICVGAHCSQVMMHQRRSSQCHLVVISMMIHQPHRMYGASYVNMREQGFKYICQFHL